MSTNGFYGKYRIEKSDGSLVDPNADYFVLRLDTDPAARWAAKEYAELTPDRGLAATLQEKIKLYGGCTGLNRTHWQITEERMRALKQAAHTCHEVTAFDTAKVLRAMLEEDTHDKP